VGCDRRIGVVTVPPTFNDDERRNFLRYTRTEQWPMFQRYPIDEELHAELLAQMLNCTPAHVRALVQSLSDVTRTIAAQMMSVRQPRAAVEALPFRDGDRVVAVGDSITADRIGWFEMLSASMDRAGNRAVSRHNLGVSGNTTADVLERFDLLEAARPTFVLVMLGTNDARSHGRPISHRMATAQETERNLLALIELITIDLGASVRLITPPAVDEGRISAFFAEMPLRWSPASVAEVADTVRKVDPGCIDIHAAMQAYGVDGLLEPDGVHPNRAGQEFIFRNVLAALHIGGPS
jgi:lysophospholipase L1-like esterase